MRITKQAKKIRGLVGPLLISSALSVSLYICRVLATHNYSYWYLVWNLFLAWLPLLCSLLLVRWLKKGRWISVKGLVLTALWIGFLPNSFYLVTDLIHLVPTNEISLLFDAVMFMTFAWNGLLLGFVSVYVVHTGVRERLEERLTVMLIGITFILCSFAVYLGRFLTWNTWDIVINPGGIIFDISDRIIKPTAYPTTFTTTTLFSVMLMTLYYTLYKLIAFIKTTGKN